MAPKAKKVRASREQYVHDECQCLQGCFCTLNFALSNLQIDLSVPRHYSGATSSGPSQTQQNVKTMFDNYRGKSDSRERRILSHSLVDDAVGEPDKIGLEGTMKYLEAIEVPLDDVIFLAVFHLLEAPAMGELSREGFVKGWSNAATNANPCDTERTQKQYIDVLRNKLSSDQVYFKQVYKNAFTYAKPVDKRAIPEDEVFAYWDMFFNSSGCGIMWNTDSIKWYDMWTEYYKEKNKRPVNKDLWNQVCELVQKTRESGGETLEWWSEDGAWPTAVDDFVAFVKERRMDTS